MIVPTLTGKLIKLRSLRADDAESIHRHIQAPDIARFLPDVPSPYSTEDADAWITRSAELADADEGCHFGIVLPDIGEAIGCIGLKNINYQDRNAEVGYWISGEHRRCGFMCEALVLIMRFAFTDLELRRLYAIVHSLNEGSWRLLEGLGYVREGIWREASIMDGEWHDVYAYGILKREFKAHLNV